jgi:hypothetical protein
MLRSALLLLVALLLFCHDGDVSRGHQVAIVATSLVSLICARSSSKLLRLVDFCFAFNAFFVITNRLSVLKYLLQHPKEQWMPLALMGFFAIDLCKGPLARCGGENFRASIELLEGSGMWNFNVAYAAFVVSRAATAHTATMAAPAHDNILLNFLRQFGGIIIV